MLKVGYHLISAVEQFHQLDMLHCDIKPDNILLDMEHRALLKASSKFGKVTLVDFGMARSYKDAKGEHLSNAVVPMEQNQWFTSVNHAQGHVLSRRDDIIQVVYSMVYFLTRF